MRTAMPLVRLAVLAPVLALVLALVFAPAPARADGGPFGLGIVLGEPTGITGLYRFGDRTAVDISLGIDALDDNGFYVHGVFLFFLPDLLGGGSVGLSPYLGPGAFVADAGNDVALGARVPFGLSLDFRRAPIQIYGEIAVGLLLVPDVDLGLGGAVGFRYFF